MGTTVDKPRFNSSLANRFSIAECTRHLLWLTLLASAILPLVSLAGEVEHSQGLLWKIEKSGQPASFLFGTVHSEDPRVLDLPDAVTQRLRSADVLVLEARLDQQAVAQSLSAMMFQDGRSLSEVLDPRLYQNAIEATAAYGLPEAAADAMKPWAIAIMLATPRPETGVFLDVKLKRQAEARGTPVEGLETIGEQLDLLNSLSMEDQIILLRDTLEQLPVIPAMHQHMIEAWLARDLGKLMTIYEQSMETGTESMAKKFDRILIQERNQRMVERMQPILKEGNGFIAVGALHLPGEQGILNLLEEQGYKVTPDY